MVDGKSRFSKPDGTLLYHNLATFSAHTVTPEWNLVKVGKDIPIERFASLGCAVVTGVGAVINTAQVKPGSTVAIWGCGGVGLNAVQGAVIAGASRVIAIDLAESKLYEMIKSGDKIAIIFFLNCQGKARGYVERQELTGKEGVPLGQVGAPVRAL